MENKQKQPKMYLEIVRELRQLIVEENIKTGGKLPSERVLAEKMDVGRSTVREALRSLELLGIIETRRGEGTFLADFQKNKIVEVLSDFILQQSTSIDEVSEMKKMIEIASIQKICQNNQVKISPIWHNILLKIDQNEPIYRQQILREMVVNSENRLALKIWMLLTQYTKMTEDHILLTDEKPYVTALLQSMVSGSTWDALVHYEGWSKYTEALRGESEK